MKEKGPNSKINSKIKFLYFCLLLLLCLSSKNIFFLGALFLFHFGLLLNRAKKLKALLHYYLEPLFIASILVLIKSFDFSSLQNTLFSLKENLHLGLRVLSAFTLFLFFYTSLSFFEMIRLMNWLKVPALFQELMFLSFKFITLLREDISLVYLSQKNRLGYSGIKESYYSLRYLVQASFFKALAHSENILQSMYQRGFNFKNILLPLEPLNLKDLFYFLIACTGWIILWIIL